MKSRIQIAIFGIGYFVGGMALSQDQSIKASDGTPTTKEGAFITRYFIGPKGEFAKLTDNVYIYTGEKIASDLGIHVENLRNRVHAPVSDYTIRPIELNHQRDRLLRIITTLNCEKYWYRIAIVNTNNLDYFWVQCFSIKRTKDYFGPEFGLFPSTFPPEISYLIAKTR